MYLLGVDFETTGLDFQTDRVIEVGAVVWDTKTSRPVALMSELISLPTNKKVSEEVQKITGIDPKDLDTFGKEGAKVFQELSKWVSLCDYIVAHNAPFDRSFMLSEMKHFNVTDFKDKHWLDTMMDIDFSSNSGSKKLTYLAADHGLLHGNAHRAAFDVMTTLKILAQYNIDKVIERSQSPSVKVISNVSYDERDLAKAMGFQWNPPNKKWIKLMKQCDLEKANFPFTYTIDDSELSF